MSKKAESSIRPPKVRGRACRLLLAGAILTPISVLALWIAVNRVEWLGPLVADGLRAVIGKEAVTEIENVAYAIQDRFYQYTRRGEKPKAYWEVPTAAPEAEPVVEDEAKPDAGGPEPTPAPRSFRPDPVGPVHASWSAPGDGHWVPIAMPDLPASPPLLYKTLLHPDKNRSWAELFVVAFDLTQVDIHLLAGTREPRATVPEALEVERPGHIPEAHHDVVLAAFNGGFKTEHGRYGMGVGELTLVEPREDVCALALFDDESVMIGSWPELAPRRHEMRFFRQTPNCMYEDGVLHEKLRMGFTKKWGATLDGETVIRRSAVGIDESATVMYVGISNHTTANAIAEGMRHAGAVTVAQLDVNFSYPKFVLFETPEDGGERRAVPLASGFEFSEHEYIRKPSRRDFFYLTPKSLRTKTARAKPQASEAHEMVPTNDVQPGTALPD